MSSLRERVLSGFKTGDRLSVKRTLTEQDVKGFADVTKDYNPVHFDERFARTKNFNSVICHGLLPASLITEIGGQVGWLATEMQFKFIKPVYIGDTVTCELVIMDINENNVATAEATVVNSDGTTVIHALLKGILPDDLEKTIIREMISEGDPTNKRR